MDEEEEETEEAAQQLRCFGRGNGYRADSRVSYTQHCNCTDVYHLDLDSPVIRRGM